FEQECRTLPVAVVNKEMTLAEYTEMWALEIAPNKMAKSTLVREKADFQRFLPALGHLKLSELRPEHFRKLYADLRKVKSKKTGKPLSEHSVEAVHACLCGILSDAMASGYIAHNPAWRTYRYVGCKSKMIVADAATTQKVIEALEEETIRYETYFKLIIATGMRRGECCGLKWGDVNYDERSIHIHRNVVKLSQEDIFVKEPKTKAGDRYVYFSAEMESLLREYETFCRNETRLQDGREMDDEDYIFRRHGTKLPMTPSTFTWQFKRILKRHNLPPKLNVHSLRHTAASLMIASGTDVTTVAGILGHAQPSTTLDIYSHAFEKNKREASAALQKELDI
ncbi:MAG: site-specific integrase, partial [Oscillospiraceae bacterium]|nr:site-specific integrase [Oscillospiraceae bacterium]